MGSGLRRIKPRSARMCLVISALVLVGFVVAGYCCYAESPARKSAQIEYITPDGQFSPVNAARLAPRAQAAAFVDNDTVSCDLREGETTFIIQVPKKSPRDRFTFLNENAAACGELRIAVSDSPLPADSPKWTEVDGIVPFAHKRLFKLSMLGVDTKFVRLSFKVESQHQDSAQLSDPFRSSLLATNISFSLGQFDKATRDFSMAAVSVAPLPANRKK